MTWPQDVIGRGAFTYLAQDEVFYYFVNLKETGFYSIFLYLYLSLHLLLNTYVQSFSLSLSLSHTHTHTHTVRDNDRH